MTPVTRSEFQRELAVLEDRALDGLDLVTRSLDHAIEALENQDVNLATIVIADDDVIDGRCMQVHQGVLSLLARQAPVATDLRLVAAILQIARHLERMGDQCVNIAKLIPMAGHHPPTDDEMLRAIGAMGRQARTQIVHAKDAFASRDAGAAEDLVRQDQLIDRLNLECFGLALEIGDDADRREWAMQMMLAARAIERIGDNTVDIGEQTAFVVTGLFREFEDASHPRLAAG